MTTRSSPPYKIAPSILSANFLNLERDVVAVQEAGADQIHVDVMDGHFVDNISMGPLVVEAIKKIATVPIDVHLMISEPLRYLGPFIDAGADHITFHVEAESPVEECIAFLREREIGVGVSLRPPTPVDRVLDLVCRVDMILVMTVNPGFGGQAFMPGTLGKIPRLREAASGGRAGEPAAGGGGRDTRAGDQIDVQVDGGIGPDTIVEAARAGANVFVAGSSIYGTADAGAAVRKLRARLEELGG